MEFRKGEGETRCRPPISKSTNGTARFKAPSDGCKAYLSSSPNSGKNLRIPCWQLPSLSFQLIIPTYTNFEVFRFLCFQAETIPVLIFRVNTGITFIFRLRRRPIKLVVFVPVGLSPFQRHCRQVLLDAEKSKITIET